MFDWLKKLRGGRPFENRTGLDSRAVGWLAEDFAVLDEACAGIAERTMRYVLDDEDGEVLAALAGLGKSAEAFGLICTQQFHVGEETSPRRQFFNSVRCSDSRFFTRLGQVYEALSRPLRQRACDPFSEPGLVWLGVLLTEANQYHLNIWPRRGRVCPALDAELVEAMIVEAGYPAETLARAAFMPPLHRFGGAEFEPLFVNMPGLGRSAIRHKAVMVAALKHPDFKQRLYALEMVKKLKVSIEPLIDELVTLALGSSKQVRELAESLLSGEKSAGCPLLERRILEGSNDEKAGAVHLLWRWEGELARPFLEARLGAEKNQKVVGAIEDVLAPAVRAPMPCKAEDILQLPPLEPMPAHAPLGPHTKQAWEECLQKVNGAIAKFNASHAGKQYRQTGLKPVSADCIRESFELMQAGGTDEAILGDLFHCHLQREMADSMHAFWQRPELTLVHLVRFLIQLGALRTHSQHDRGILCYGHWLEQLLPLYRRAHPEVGLRELGMAFTAAGLDASRIGRGLLQSYNATAVPLGLPVAQVWPYWAEYLDVLEEAFAPAGSGVIDRYDQRIVRRNALLVLAAFPYPPGRLVPLLWKLALGAKAERASAQRCLEPLMDKLDRLVASLSSRDAETRSSAAEWLGRLGDAQAVPTLLSGLQREKNEVAKGMMMSALEACGATVDQFLDREALAQEAGKGLAKGVPEGLLWFPFDRLPEVHWSDDSRPVEPVILRWWLIQGFKLKNPAPGVLLRRHCACFKASERESLGQFVLEAWIAQDTSPRTGAAAEQEALARAHGAVQSAQQLAKWIQQNPQVAQQMAAHIQPQKTVEEYYQEILPQVLREPTASAIASKGILALAGACVGSGAAPVVNRYLKDWYGTRSAQCRALLQMLAWVEHKTATQLLLAVGSRFRTKGIQEEANQLAQAVAERKGWTVAELADRTIPSAGMDEAGTLTLDFGPRQFTARLNAELEFTLLDAEGKALKSLPDPRKDDDEAKATEAKKIFTGAKKELKSVVALQRDRLYEAMCTQRTWLSDEWNACLNLHPIVRHHCQRLVWGVVRDGTMARLFRPLPDGTLTDANDDPVTLATEDLVGVAHECQVTPTESLAWRQHLKDYDIEPLFQQLGRCSFSLGEGQAHETLLSDYQGHVLEAFKLRGRANKLGYTRGPAQDGGWFYDYQKRFPTLGVEAVIEFTGNGLPEDNRTVALRTLHFARVSTEEPGMGAGQKMSLGEVPSVLLSECWNDLRQIAAEGPGFDSDWEKKTAF